MKVRINNLHVFPLMFLVFIGIFSCDHEKKTTQCNHNILVVVAHPDDETLVSGTLAKLIDRGCEATVVFTTSGDDGPDMTGQGLHGNALAEVREKEAQRSLNHIGVKNPPVFLRFPDGYVWENSELIRDSLFVIYARVEPQIIITFGPDGVTDDPDHITTGFVTDQVFDSLNTGKLLLHIAISYKANQLYPIPAPVDDFLIDLRVDVSDYKQNRKKSNDVYHTQFGRGQRLFWKIFVGRFPYEEFVIAGNREGDKLLENCF